MTKQKLVNSLWDNLVRSTVKTVELNWLWPDWSALRKENLQPSRFPRDNLHFDTPELLTVDRLLMQLMSSTGTTNAFIFYLKNGLLKRNTSLTQLLMSSLKIMYKICRIVALKMSLEQIVCPRKSVFRTRFARLRFFRHVQMMVKSSEFLSREICHT